MTRIGTEVIFEALLVANIYEQAFEYSGAAALVHGYEHSALQHILQQAGSLQTHRFSAGIGARYEQYAPFTV